MAKFQEITPSNRRVLKYLRSEPLSKQARAKVARDLTRKADGAILRGDVGPAKGGRKRGAA